MAEPRAGGLRRACFAAAAFGSLLIPGILQAGIVPQEMGAILKDFDLTEADFGGLAAGIAAAASLLGLSAIWLTPRLGIYRVCLLGYALFAVGLGSAALWPYGRLALVMGTLTACGLAYLHLGNGLVVQIAPHRAASMTNLLHGINSLGKAIGPLFSRIGNSWREPFLSVAGLGILLGLAGWVGRGSVPAARAVDSGGEREAPAREALRDPLFWCCGLVFVPIVATEQATIFWLPRYLTQYSGLGSEAGSSAAFLAASVILWTELVVRFTASYLMTRFSPLLILCLCVPGSAGILLGTEGGHWTGGAALLGYVACGIGFATPGATFFAISSRYFPRHRGLLSILSGGATSLAVILCFKLGGSAKEWVGLKWVLRASPLLGLVTLAAVLSVNLMGERRLRGMEAGTPPGPNPKPE